MGALFVSDLHGREERYERLFRAIRDRRPGAVFLGGDLLPHALSRARAPREEAGGVAGEIVAPGFTSLRREMGEAYPRVFAILGNDDPGIERDSMIEHEASGLWSYDHGRRFEWEGFDVYGYACVPPTPFRLKDWERYDVSRYVDPGCSAPAEGLHTVAVEGRELEWATIRGSRRARGRRRPRAGGVPVPLPTPRHSPPSG